MASGTLKGLKIKEVEINVDSVTIAAGGMSDIKIDGSSITATALGVPANSLRAVIFTWATGHVCTATQCYVAGNKNGVTLSLSNVSSSSITVTKVQFTVFYE